jgi:hypothetical protein
MLESDVEEESAYDSSESGDDWAPMFDLDEMMADISEPNLDLDGPQERSGARIRPCLSALQQIHQQKILAGEAPSWLFADYLEFEFVKWMVDHNISQGAQDKLIKLPIVSQFRTQLLGI